MELFYRSVVSRKLTPPLLMNVQMYGVTAVFLYLLSRVEMPLVVRLLCIVVFTTGIEFTVGFSYFKTTGIRLWDYSDRALNYKGFICLEFSFYWLALSILYLQFVVPIIIHS